ncbi:MAG: deoxyribose-phosphate aldolase [Candidatus Berkelbacteria bacterium]|nr:deoxyribose-phosphate aldolase [Candidatus Berkelbacteria bacterium]
MITEEITAQTVVKYIDHTNVKADATTEDIKKLCQEAVQYGFHSVCVTPYRVKTAKEALGEAKTVIICVVGFPFGFTTTEEKINEAKTAIGDGATEIDMVQNIGTAKEGNFSFVKEEVSRIAEAIKPIGLKVIMEIGFLSEEELRQSCIAAKEAGAEFVKTSTGYGPRPPTVEDIRIMKEAVADEVKIKASGGIETLEQAKVMLEAGAIRLGTSHALQIIGQATSQDQDASFE